VKWVAETQVLEVGIAKSSGTGLFSQQGLLSISLVKMPLKKL